MGFSEIQAPELKPNLYLRPSPRYELPDTNLKNSPNILGLSEKTKRLKKSRIFSSCLVGVTGTVDSKCHTRCGVGIKSAYNLFDCCPQ